MNEWPHERALRDRIAGHLQARPARGTSGSGLRDAAVSIALLTDDGAATFLLTRRSSRLARHSGQYALPGGRVDPGEDVEAAALRELSEELGVFPDAASVLGRLDDLPTASGWRITPFVLWLDDVRLKPDPGEVDAVFRIPLAELFARPDPQGPERIAPEPGAFWMHLPTLGHEVYAPTAAILRQFREVALMGREAEMLAYREPGFARQ